MQNFIPFLLQNWPYVLLLALIALTIAWFETRTTVGGIQKVDPQTLVRLMNHQEATVIDIRDANAYKTGHIVGSINIPAAQFQEKNKKLQKYKDKPVAIVCALGQSSLKIAKELKQLQFTQVYSLNGGISAWKNASLPLEKN